MAVQLKEEPIELFEVKDRATLRAFIDLPNRLYRGRPGYVVPLDLERRESLSPQKNAYFRHADHCYWLAFRDGQPVGRISAQVDRLHQERHDAETGHFGLLDAEDDPALFQTLLGTAEDWLKSRGKTRVQGPFNLSINEECGLQVAGFGEPAMLMMGYGEAYAGRHLEGLGYARAKDLLAYDMQVDAAIEVRGAAMLKRLNRDGRVTIRPVDMKRYKAELGVILKIFNEAWADNWGFVPFTEAEMTQIATGMRPLVRPSLNWIAEVDGVPAAMIICLPNLYEAIGDLDGKLLPFGWAKLLWRLKTQKFESCRVPLMGVRKQFQGSVMGAALTLLLFQFLRNGLLEEGFKRVEMSWVLEDNLPMRRLIEDLGARPYKTYRLYEKALA
jgi:hypothetical protein